jgi:hypothetical protein
VVQKIIVLCLFLLLLSACSEPEPTPIPSSPTPTETPLTTITESDKAHLVKIAAGYGASRLFDSNILFDNQNNIILSVENLNSDWIPELDNFTIHPLTRAEIQERAEAEGQLMFLMFERIDFHEDGTAEIVVSSLWAAPQGEDIPLTGGSALLSFRQIDGEWQRQVEWEMDV